MKKCLLLAILFLYFNLLQAQSGQLDTSFGIGGIITSDIGVNDPDINNDQSGERVLINTEGDLFFICGNPFLNYKFVSKKNNEGRPDVSYGNNGYSTTLNLSGYSPSGIQKDGKIVIVGHLSAASNSFYSVFRLNTNGSLDSSFNGKGKTKPSSITISRELGIAFQNDGKVLVGGTALVNNTQRHLLYRLNNDGSEDESFRQIGKPIDAVVSYFSLAIQEDGKIIAGGNKMDKMGNNIFSLTRHLTNGSIDTSFNSRGIPETYTTLNGLPIGGFTMNKFPKIFNDADGNILVTGNIKNNFGIARFKKDGSFDTLVTTKFAGTSNYLMSASIGGDGTIMLAGSVENNTTIVSYNKNLSLNTNFSEDGILLDISPDLIRSVSALIVQKDGKPVLIGYVYKGDYPTTAAVRFNTNGSIDESFANNGKLQENILQANTAFNSVAIQNDGKIIAGGFGSNGKDLDFALARYNTNGSLDKSFSGDGKLMTDSGIRSSTNYIQSIAIQTDGKIIANGYGERSASLVRYNSNGTVEHNYGSGTYSNAIVIQKDGKFIRSTLNSLVRFRNFSVDNNFSVRGSLTFPILNNTPFSSKAVALQKDEKIIVLGTADKSCVLRYDTNGKLDSSFGTNGIAYINYKSSTDMPNSICVQADDKILIGGSFQDTSAMAVNTFSIARLSKDGGPDNSFNKGEVLHPVSEGTDIGNAIAVQSDGKIIMAGNAINDGLSFFRIVRLNGDGTIDKTFNNTGSTKTYVGGADAIITDIAIQGNNLYAAGYALFPGSKGIIAKYLLCSTANLSPMKVISFEGHLQNDRTSLNWQVQYQKHLSYFSLEKSSDSVHFTFLENIAVNYINTSAYTTIDNNPFTGANFYRLKLKNIDSSYSYSKIVTVNFTNENRIFKLSPNPAKNKLIVTTSGENENAILQIFDIFGRKFKEVKVSINGNTIISVDVSALPDGIYNLKLIKKSVTNYTNFIKQ